MPRSAMSGHAATCKLCGTGFAPYSRGVHAYCKRCTTRADREAERALHVDCKECGKRFDAPSRRVRYCSDACRVDGTRRRNRVHQRRYMADPEKRAVAIARARAYSAASASRRRGGRPPQPQAPSRADPNAEPSVCRLCGRAFAQYGRGIHAYCKRCTAKADREAGRTLRMKCSVCGSKFSTAARSAKYCSDECRADAKLRGYLERYRRFKADPKRRAMAAARERARHAARAAVEAGG